MGKLLEKRDLEVLKITWSGDEQDFSSSFQEQHLVAAVSTRPSIQEPLDDIKCELHILLHKNQDALHKLRMMADERSAFVQG